MGETPLEWARVTGERNCTQAETCCSGEGAGWWRASVSEVTGEQGGLGPGVASGRAGHPGRLAWQRGWGTVSWAFSQ